MKDYAYLLAGIVLLLGGARVTAEPPTPPAPAPQAPAPPAPAAPAPAPQAPPAAASVPTPEWARVAKEQSEEAERLKVPVAFENPVGMRFVLIPAGSFLMGSPAEEAGREEAAEVQHKVTLTKAYYMAIHETTNGQWLKYTRDLPSLPKYAGDDRPVNYVSQVTAGRFVRWLNTQDPGHAYALPTEAQWERACRAGGQTPFATGATLTQEQANFGDKQGTTKSVGSFAPNAWGLYDMHGNVLEWCVDRFAPYPAEDALDPVGPATGDTSVMRGGSWVHEARWLRCAARHDTIPNDEYHLAGFRLIAATATP